jgi:hypothetical protein
MAEAHERREHAGDRARLVAAFLEDPNPGQQGPRKLVKESCVH